MATVVNVNSGKRGTKVSTDKTASGKVANSKVGKVIGSVGKFAAKFGNLIPGVGGIVSTIGKIASKNDPEWWQNVPGTGVSTNTPLSPFSEDIAAFDALVDASDETVPNKFFRTTVLRPSVLEFVTETPEGESTNYAAINPSDQQVSTYLMQEIRKVLNAIPLQRVEAYRDILINSATAYALKKQLDKYIALAENSKPYIPALTDGSFPILAPANHALMVSLRDSLKEYIKASVKLPHTLCQYLSWRFGRVYRMGSSEKTGIVLYDVISITSEIGIWSKVVANVIGFATSTDSYIRYAWETGTEKSQALADMYNAYIDHVIDVEIPVDTQFTYDPKEFVLRTNLDLTRITADGSSDIDEPGEAFPGAKEVEMVYMDSLLDNKTTFMASTVSTEVMYNDERSCLFPVSRASFFMTDRAHLGKEFKEAMKSVALNAGQDAPLMPGYEADAFVWTGNQEDSLGSYWSVTLTGPIVYNSSPEIGVAKPELTVRMILPLLFAALAKATEFYNVELYAGTALPYDDPEPGELSLVLDLTAPSTDLARVPLSVIANTHTYAFANLVYQGVKSYAAKEMPKAIAAAEATLEEVAKISTPAADGSPTAQSVANTLTQSVT